MIPVLGYVVPKDLLTGSADGWGESGEPTSSFDTAASRGGVDVNQSVRSATRTVAGLAAITWLMMAATAWCKPGDLLWESLRPSDLNGTAYAVGAQDDVVVATGESGADCSPYVPGSCNWFVRAFNAATGDTLWKDSPVTSDSIGRATAVAISDDRVIAVGWMLGVTRYEFVARAYRLKDGKLLWEQRINRDSTTTERAYAVEVRDGDVYVAGDVASAPGVQDFALLVFDEKTGRLRWESDTPGPALPPSGATFAVAEAVRIQDGRVFTAGTILESSGADAVVLQAHDAKSGAALWETRIPNAYFLINLNNFDGLAVGADLVFIGAGIGTSDPNVGFDFLVRAYDKRTGALVWSDQVHRQAGGQATRVVFKDGKLFAYGWDCDETVYNCYGNVRAYEAKTGTLKWESRFTGLGGDSLVPTVSLAVHGDQVFIGNGLLDSEQDSYKWTVRSYDAKDGTILWEHQSADEGYLNRPFALKASKGRLFAVGAVNRSDDSFAFSVRAYSAATRDDSGCDSD